MFKRLLLAGFLLWGAFINSYLTAHLVCVDCVAPLALVNHAAHYLTLLAVVILVLALIFRCPRAVLLWLLPGVLAFGVWYGELFLPQPAPEVEGIEITAATYNVLGFLADPNQSFQVIESMEADFVALQELRPTLDSKLQTELAEKYPYQVSKVVQEFDGLALLSKYPIVES